MSFFESEFFKNERSYFLPEASDASVSEQIINLFLNSKSPIKNNIQLFINVIRNWSEAKIATKYIMTVDRLLFIKKIYSIQEIEEILCIFEYDAIPRVCNTMIKELEAGTN